MMKILRMLMASLQAGNRLMPFPVCNEVITAANPVPSTIHDDPVPPGSFLFSEETDESIVDRENSKVKSKNSKEGHSHAAERTLNNLPRVNDELANQVGEQKRKDIPRWLVNDDLAAFTAVADLVVDFVLRASRKTHHSRLTTHDSPHTTHNPSLLTTNASKNILQTKPNRNDPDKSGSFSSFIPTLHNLTLTELSKIIFRKIFVPADFFAKRKVSPVQIPLQTTPLASRYLPLTKTAR